MAEEHARAAEDLTRDLDLIVFELERAAADDVAALQDERGRLRRKLEKLRDRLEELSERMR